MCHRLPVVENIVSNTYRIYSGDMSSSGKFLRQSQLFTEKVHITV
jgi:hypothetical protein